VYIYKRDCSNADHAFFYSFFSLKDSFFLAKIVLCRKKCFFFLLFYEKIGKNHLKNASKKALKFSKKHVFFQKREKLV